MFPKHVSVLRVVCSRCFPELYEMLKHNEPMYYHATAISIPWFVLGIMKKKKARRLWLGGEGFSDYFWHPMPLCEEKLLLTDLIYRQQLCKHGPTRNNRRGCVFYAVRATPSAAEGQINSQSDTWHVFSVWSAPCNNRGAVFSVRGPYGEDTRDYENRNSLHLSSEVPREQQFSWRIRSRPVNT
jgi:hypothetical protein